MIYLAHTFSQKYFPNPRVSVLHFMRSRVSYKGDYYYYYYHYYYRDMSPYI